MQPIPLRVPADTIERLDALTDYVATDPALRATGHRVLRADVIRLALDLGVRALEERRAAGLPPMGAPRP